MTTTDINTRWVDDNQMIWVETKHLPILTEKRDELAKVAKRYGLVAPTFTIVETVTRVESRLVDDVAIDVPVEYAHVEIIERPLVLDGGWTFVAVVEHTTAGNMVKAGPGIDESILRQYLTVDGTCDHCGIRRQRGTTVVVSDVDGNLRRVGKQCLKVYLPGWSLPLTDAMGNYLLSLDGWYNVESGESFGVSRDREPYEMIMAAIRAIEVYGYKPTSFGVESTKEVVSMYLWPSTMPSEHEKSLRQALKAVDRQVVGQVYALVMEYVAQLDAKSDRSVFESNMIVAARVGGVRNLGLAVYVAEAYRKHLLGAIEAAKVSTGETVKVDAPIGRTTIVGTVEKITLKYNQFTGRDDRKLIIADDRGFKVYVSEPSNLYCDAGMRISVSVDIKSVSDRDSSFGFGSRPTKATEIDENGQPIVVKLIDLYGDDDL